MQRAPKKKKIFHVHLVMETQWTAHSFSERDDQKTKERKKLFQSSRFE